MGNSFGYNYNSSAWQLPPRVFVPNNWSAGLSMNNVGNWNNFSWGGNNFNGGWNSSCWGNNFGGGWNSTTFGSTSPSIMTSSSETTEQREAKEKKELAEKRKNEKNAKEAEKAEENCWQLLSEDYAKSMTPSESLLAAAGGGAAFGLVNNPRILAHPINTYKGFKDTKKMFASVTKEGSKLHKAWKANSPVMEEAYAQMQKLASRHNSKIGLFRKKISDADYKALKKVMVQALKTEDPQKIADATAKLKHSYVNDGVLSKLWYKIRGKSVPTVTEKLGETSKIADVSKNILKHGKDMSYLDALKKGGGVKGGLIMAGVEVLMSLGKIKAAFSKDSETGMKQVGQTAVKAAGNAAGWAVGEALGVWGAAKLGATIGTAFGPGVGTAIGAVAGLVVGSIGCWAAGKLTHLIVGDDVGDKCLAESKTKDDNGKLELLNNAIARANNNEIKDEKTLQAVQALATKYQATA